MVRRIFLLFVLVYLGYSFTVYYYCDKVSEKPPADALAGFGIWQSRNCQGCHQLYGLGGYMGPDLTNLMSDPLKGEAYAFALMKGGTARMPNFKLSDEEIKKTISFLNWVNQSGKSFVPADKVTWYGNYNLEGK